MRLANKVALVAPGAYGVGHDASVRFAAEGAKVLVCGTDEENGRRTLEAIAREARGGGEGAFQRCDILREDDVRAAVLAAHARFGALDIVFGWPDAYVPGACADQPLRDLDWTLEYNCRSLFYLAKHAAPRMAERLSGSFVFLTSVYAEVSGSSSCAYEVSKGTAANMTLAFAERYGPRRVRFNAVAHGHIVEGARGLKDEAPVYLVRDERESDRLATFYPAGRLALGDEVARAAVFLASDEAAYVTGATLRVDGGFVTR